MCGLVGFFSIRIMLNFPNNVCKLNFVKVTVGASKISCSSTATAIVTTPNDHLLL